MENNMKIALDQFALYNGRIFLGNGWQVRHDPIMTYFTKVEYNHQLFLKHRLYIYNKMDELNTININNIIISKFGDDINSVIFKYIGKYNTKRDKLPNRGFFGY